MKIVIDTNIIFSSLLSKNEDYLKIFLNNSFYAPNYLIYEIFKYRPKIEKYSKLSIYEIEEFFSFLVKKINFVKEETISKNSWQKAYNLCYDIDINDIAFVALSIEIDGFLLTGDKKLKNGLKEKGFDKLIDIKDLL